MMHTAPAYVLQSPPVQGHVDVDWKPPTFAGLSNSEKIIQSQQPSGGPCTSPADGIPAYGTVSHGIAASDMPTQRASNSPIPSPGENDARNIMTETKLGRVPVIVPEGRFSLNTPAPQQIYQPAQSRAVRPVGDSEPCYASDSEAAKYGAITFGRVQIPEHNSGATFSEPCSSRALSPLGGTVDVTSTSRLGRDNSEWPWRDPGNEGGGKDFLPNPRFMFGKSHRDNGNAAHKYDDTAAPDGGYSPAPPTKRRSSTKSGARRRSSGSSTRAKSSRGGNQHCSDQVRSTTKDRGVAKGGRVRYCSEDCFWVGKERERRRDGVRVW